MVAAPGSRRRRSSGNRAITCCSGRVSFTTLDKSGPIVGITVAPKARGTDDRQFALPAWGPPHNFGSTSTRFAPSWNSIQQRSALRFFCLACDEDKSDDRVSQSLLEGRDNRCRLAIVADATPLATAIWHQAKLHEERAASWLACLPRSGRFRQVADHVEPLALRGRQLPLSVGPGLHDCIGHPP